MINGSGAWSCDHHLDNRQTQRSYGTLYTIKNCSKQLVHTVWFETRFKRVAMALSARQLPQHPKPLHKEVFHFPAVALERDENRRG